MDKVYLRELEAAGVAIPPTRWFEPGESLEVAAVLRDLRWPEAVLKPRVSATARGTYRVSAGAVPTGVEWGELHESGAMLQQFIPEVQSRGEVSLMYLDSAYSHAALKTTAEGEFRVQKDFGGSAVRIQPGEALLEFGAAVLAAVPLPWLYARVDVIEAAGGPLLVELELIEPELFFTLAPEAAGTLAQALMRRAGSGGDP